MNVVVHRPLPPIHRTFDPAYWFFLACGIAAIAYTAVTVLEGVFYQAEDTFQPDISGTKPQESDTPRLRLTAFEGAPISRLEIPRLGMSVLVAEGTNSHTLKLGAGHIRGTAYPDETGNIGIAGHRDTFFRALRSINAGDIIVLTTAHQAFRYSVEWTRVVQPADVNVLRPSPEPVLTLVTCYPFKFVGSAPERFIVRARRLAH